MNHSLAQVFGAGPPLLVPKRALVGCAVIFENPWVIHGDIRGTLFKVAYRIAAVQLPVVPIADSELNGITVG
jgi:hypothetical protein